MTSKINLRFPEPNGLWPTPVPPQRQEERSDAERIAVIEEGAWIPHRAEREAVTELRSFLQRPWATHQRWRGMMVIGDPLSGRSMLIARAIQERRRLTSRRIATVRLPLPMSDAKFWGAIIEGRGRSGRGSMTAREAKEQALSGIEDCEALIFDDGDGLAILGPRIWPALAKLKSVGEERRVPIILVASTRLATKIAGNDEWRDRFETVRLPRLRLDRDFLDLLTAWEARLPLRDVSHLSERDLAMHLYALCDGSIGRLAQILRKASLAAIESATERITVPLLDNLGFSPPPSFKGFPF